MSLGCSCYGEEASQKSPWLLTKTDPESECELTLMWSSVIGCLLVKGTLAVVVDFFSFYVHRLLHLKEADIFSQFFLFIEHEEREPL